jgi:hypothetical protein
MVKCVWIGGKLVCQVVSDENAASLPQFVHDTLNLGLVAVADGIAYANDLAHAQQRLGFEVGDTVMDSTVMEAQ